MALQTTGPISLSNIQAEFGGSNPISISEYYNSNYGVPLSGTIRFSDFYGTHTSWFSYNIGGNRTTDLGSGIPSDSKERWDTDETGNIVYPPVGTYLGTIYVDPELPPHDPAVIDNGIIIRKAPADNILVFLNNDTETVQSLNFSMTINSSTFTGFYFDSIRKVWDGDPSDPGGGQTAVNRVIVDDIQVFYHAVTGDVY